jgi:hypothetical protein
MVQSLMCHLKISLSCDGIAPRKHEIWGAAEAFRPILYSPRRCPTPVVSSDPRFIHRDTETFRVELGCI